MEEVERGEGRVG